MKQAEDGGPHLSLQPGRLSASHPEIPLLFAFGPQSTCCSFCRTQGVPGHGSLLSHPAKLYPQMQASHSEKEQRHPEMKVKQTNLLRYRMSKCSITSMLPPPGASRTLMGLGTFTVPVFRMAVKLAISPSNILLACQRNNRGGEK